MGIRRGRLGKRTSPMKELLLLGLLATGMLARQAHAQPGSSAIAADAATATASYRGHVFPRKRTPVEQLPLEGQAEILRLETLLQQASTALLADSTGAVLPAWRADAVEQAAQQAAAVAPAWIQDDYRREAAFYAAEEARRHPATPGP